MISKLIRSLLVCMTLLHGSWSKFLSEATNASMDNASTWGFFYRLCSLPGIGHGNVRFVGKMQENLCSTRDKRRSSKKLLIAMMLCQVKFHLCVMEQLSSRLTVAMKMKVLKMLNSQRLKRYINNQRKRNLNHNLRWRMRKANPGYKKWSWKIRPKTNPKKRANSN